jgi:hypothetical protein
MAPLDTSVKSVPITFITGLTLLIPASIGLFVSGVPTVLCPFPTLTFLPALLLSSWGLQGTAVIVPVLLFFVWNPGLFRGEIGIPVRSYVLMAVLTVLSLVDFVASWKLGLRYQGAPYTYTVCAVNIMWVCLLGVLLAVGWKTKSSFKCNLILHWALFAWLCWYAFPYMGELI